MLNTYTRFNKKSSGHRAAFARDAVFASFRGRDAKAIDYDDFQDRRPCDEPVRLDHAATDAVGSVGGAALHHWLTRADRTTGVQRDEALRHARAIARLVGAPWTGDAA